LGCYIGIDFGLTNFATFSDGTKIKNNKFLKKSEKKLAKEQRILSRRYKQSLIDERELKDCKNYQKQRIKVAKVHEKIKNQREDFSNKLSTEIIKNHDIICIEDLDIKGMLKEKQLSKHIADASWGSFINKLSYKAVHYNKKIVKIDREFPSSKLCSNCGNVLDTLSISVREWVCPSCNCSHDRDINAAVNILTEGLRMISY
jgi:putative transposase